MKILITGATGFIGLHLVEQLCGSQHEIVCAVRAGSKTDVLENYKEVRIEKIDFENQQELRDICEGVEVVFHLAGQMGGFGVPYEKFYKTNCELTKRLVIIAAERGVKQFIYCSTPGVLGFGKRLAEEKEPYNPRNPYEKTKVLAEKTVKKFCGSTGSMKYTIVRPDFVYGPGDVRRVKMYKGIERKRFVLTTSGKSYLHPTYVMDIVQGMLCCMGNEAAYNETFNLAAEQDVTSKDYLKTIAECTDSRLIQINIGTHLSRIFAGIIDKMFKVFLKKEGFVSRNKIDFLAMDHSSSIEKAKREIGYKPKYSCKRGMELTIQWCRENNLM